MANINVVFYLLVCDTNYYLAQFWLYNRQEIVLNGPNKNEKENPYEIDSKLLTNETTN